MTKKYSFIRVPPETHKRIKICASLQGKTIGDYLNSLTKEEDAPKIPRRGFGGLF